MQGHTLRGHVGQMPTSRKPFSAKLHTPRFPRGAACKPRRPDHDSYEPAIFSGRYHQNRQGCGHETFSDMQETCQRSGNLFRLSCIRPSSFSWVGAASRTAHVARMRDVLREWSHDSTGPNGSSYRSNRSSHRRRVCELGEGVGEDEGGWGQWLNDSTCSFFFKFQCHLYRGT
jgi:hypothetical protein